jgi:serine phosphatase RsbU (regulator of sigma subunit)
VAPSHTLRHQARVFLARVGTAVAVFIAIAVVLLSNAQANNGPPDQVDPPAPVEEPVLGDPSLGDPAVEAPADDPATEDPGTAPEDPGTAPEEPTTDDPTPEEPPTEDPGSEDPNAGEGEEPPTTEPPGEDPGTGEGEDPTSGGDKGTDDGTTDPDNPPDEGGEEDPTPPSGGSKGDDPPDDDQPAEEPAPDPNSRPQVILPDDTGDEPGPTTPPDSEPGNPPGIVGDGEGNVADAGDVDGGGGEGDNTVRFGVASGTNGGAGANGGAGGGGALADGTQLAAVQPGEEQPGGNDGNGPDGNGDNGGGGGGDEGNNVVTNTVERLVKVVPDELKAALAALAALSIMLGVGYLLAALRARRLARQRSELLQEVGLLQTALLPPVPDKVGALLTSVAYRPAEGPGAGGDFYDVLPLTGGRVGFILGDVSGHGRGALARTAFMRYTLRAYLEAGLEPRVALQVAGRVIDDNLGGDFATVLLAVHDPDTGSLTYASAGHPAPIVVGPQEHEPVTAASSPPIGVGVRTGLRQSTVPLVPGAVACLFTDGLMEARTPEGVLGRERLTELLAELGDDATARRLIERVAAEANASSDDMAAVVVSPTAGVTTGLFRTEQLELSTRELEGPIARRFLEACGLSDQEVEDAERDARLLAERFGGVVLHVVFGNRLRVEVLPRNVESIEAASRRVSAGNPQ